MCGAVCSVIDRLGNIESPVLLVLNQLVFWATNVGGIHAALKLYAVVVRIVPKPILSQGAPNES